MSVLEIAMLICFGFAWPFSIYKSYKSETTRGKSPIFLMIVIAGYLAGIAHKIFYNFDLVICFYVINFLMVSIDLMLYLRNNRLEKAA